MTEELKRDAGCIQGRVEQGSHPVCGLVAARLFNKVPAAVSGILVLSIPAWFLLSCAQPPANAEFRQSPGKAFSEIRRARSRVLTPVGESTQLVHSPKTQVLEIARVSLTKLGFEILTNDTQRGFIRTKQSPVVVPDDCDCGDIGSSRISGFGSSTFVVEVRETNEVGTKLGLESFCETYLTFQRRRIQCASTGKLEQQFWKSFDQAVAESNANLSGDHQR